MRTIPRPRRRDAELEGQHMLKEENEKGEAAAGARRKEVVLGKETFGTRKRPRERRLLELGKDVDDATAGASTVRFQNSKLQSEKQNAEFAEGKVQEAANAARAANSERRVKKSRPRRLSQVGVKSHL